MVLGAVLAGGGYRRQRTRRGDILMSDLVERLRIAEKNWSTHALHDGDFDAAADLIKQQDAEIERLKADPFDTAAIRQQITTELCGPLQAEIERLKAKLASHGPGKCQLQSWTPDDSHLWEKPE